MYMLTSQTVYVYDSNHLREGYGYYARRECPRLSLREVRAYVGAPHYEDAQDLPKMPESILEHATNAGS